MKMKMMMSLSASFLAMMSSISIIMALLLLVATPPPAIGFGGVVAPLPMLTSNRIHSSSLTVTSTGSRRTTTSLYAIRCEDKFYQLEEMEDADTCTTEVFLNADRTTTFGRTDGPVPMQVMGSWQIVPGTNDFTMTIVRTFKSGDKHKDVGEFTYDVKRTYTGEMTMVGASVGITGVIHDDIVDENNAVQTPQEVGFFNMIDGTEEREGYGKMYMKVSSN